MAVGDSVTAGNGSSSGDGYRGPLWTLLRNDGDPLDFVGSQRNGVMFDPDHEGYPGQRIDNIAGLINNELAVYQPNVVLLHIGTNDMGQPYQPDTAYQRLGSLIDQILANDAGATVIVAQLIPNSTGWVQTNINNYNSQIPGVVQARVNQGKKVFMVSMTSLTLSDLADGLHPNDGGYQKMANIWHTGIQSVISKGWVSNIDFAGVFSIVNLNSNLAVDVSGGSKSNGASIIQYAYQGNSNQLWNFIPTNSGYYQIKNANSAEDMNVSGASTTNSALIVQWPFGTQGNDQWKPVRNSDGSYTFINRLSNLCLDVPGWSTAQNVQLDQWGSNSGNNQRFSVSNR